MTAQVLRVLRSSRMTRRQREDRMQSPETLEECRLGLAHILRKPKWSTPACVLWPRNSLY